MSLQQRIEDDLLIAVKSKDQLSRDVLRGIKSALKNQEIELKTSPLDDAEIEKIVSKETKKRKESIEAYKKVGKPDLVEIEQAELKILKQYLPPELPLEDVEKIIDIIINDLGENANIGMVMKEASNKLRGKTDMGAVSKLVTQKLAK